MESGNEGRVALDTLETERYCSTMNDSGRIRIFLDGGGTGYNSPSEPVDESFDCNKWLYQLTEEFKKFLSDRIYVEELVARLDTRLYSAGWFIPLGYRLFVGDLENEQFVGSYAEKAELANSAETDFTLQLRCSFEQDACIEMLVNTENPEKQTALQLARIVANSCNQTFDIGESFLERYDIGECSLYDNELELRSFASDSKHVDHAHVTMVFNLDPGSDFAKYLQSNEAITGLIQGFMLAFDNVVDSGLLKGKHD